MKRILLSTAAILFIVGAFTVSAGGKKSAQEVQIDVDARNPWTHLRWNNAPDTFHFAVVSDRTGGHRQGVFTQAVDKLNLMQPAFVVSVGDLIEGYTKDKKKMGTQWKEFQGFVHKLQMPFFYVPGNHDLSNAAEVEEWKQRFGRRYYHFLYKEVLFLAVATDDEGEDGGKRSYGAISKEQVEYFQKVLKENPSPRWIVVMIHKPVWSLERANTEGWIEIEKSLTGRKYTVFAGHVHRFQKFVRNGMNYYQLATTGGGSKMRGLDYNEFDHITWVTMKADGGPVISHLQLDGILPEDLKVAPSAEDGYALLNRKPVQPVRGKVLFNGVPVVKAKVAFHLVDEASKKSAMIADGFTEADGSFVLTSYVAWDGAPVGEYVVTVVQREPYFDNNGQPGPNRLPGKYASINTTDLRANVVLGENQFALNLTP